MNNRLVMELGERRKLSINVFSKKNDVFILQSAQVLLYRLNKDVLELESECTATIEGTKVHTEIEPHNAGFYTLKAVMGIADEQIIKKFYLSVNN